MDHRRERRFRASFPVEIEPGGGLTIDMSNSGIAFETTRDYKPGDEIRQRIIMGRRDSDSSLDLHCSGKVVRVEKIGDNNRVGASVDWIDDETGTPLPTLGW